jgi:hypothetical protein
MTFNTVVIVFLMQLAIPFGLHLTVGKDIVEQAAYVATPKAASEETVSKVLKIALILENFALSWVVLMFTGVMALDTPFDILISIDITGKQKVPVKNCA